MPYKSRSQARFMHSDSSPLSPSQIKEWDSATKAKKGGFGKLPEKKWRGGYAFGGEAEQDEGALDRFMERRRRMACGGMAYGGETGMPGQRGMGKTYAEGGAVEQVWQPLDEQDSDLLDEEDESDRHRREFMLAFAGALAKSRRR